MSITSVPGQGATAVPHQYERAEGNTDGRMPANGVKAESRKAVDDFGKTTRKQDWNSAPVVANKGAPRGVAPLEQLIEQV